MYLNFKLYTQMGLMLLGWKFQELSHFVHLHLSLLCLTLATLVLFICFTRMRAHSIVLLGKMRHSDALLGQNDKMSH